MRTKFFTNEDGNTLLKRFVGVFEHLPNIEFFDALVGYFRSSGYFAIRPYLDQVPQLRILVGINVDRMIATYHADTKDTEAGILQFIDDVVSGKMQIRAHPHRKLHAKIYIFRPENFSEYFSGEVITGSSNLTDPGLGNSETSNIDGDSRKFPAPWHDRNRAPRRIHVPNHNPA